jgi:hypothetical protein
VTTLTCRGFTATPLASGEIRLEIAEAKTDAVEERLGLAQIALCMNRTVKSVQKLSRRKKNPLPIYRGNGRPYGFRSELNAWLRVLNDPSSTATRTVFG